MTQRKKPNGVKAQDTFDTAQVNGPQGLMDPLKQIDDSRRELFGRYSKASAGFAQRDVAFAAVNLILNSIRQQCRTAREAELMLDEITAFAKTNLLELHYFPSGLRRQVFPHTQVIEMPVTKSEGKIF